MLIRRGTTGGGAACSLERWPPGPVELEVVAEASAASGAESVARAVDSTLRFRPPQEADWEAGGLRVERSGETVRVAVRTGRADLIVAALAAAGANRIEVRGYPDAASREAWSEFGAKREPAETQFVREVVHVSGGKARVLMPIVAAGLVAVSLERLELLLWPAAAALFVLMLLFVVVTEGRRSRSRVWFVRYDRAGPALSKDARPPGEGAERLPQAARDAEAREDAERVD